MKDDLWSKLSGIAIVLIIVACIMHPSLWIGAIGSVLHIIVVVCVAKIVCRLVLKKSLRELILGEDDK